MPGGMVMRSTVMQPVLWLVLAGCTGDKGSTSGTGDTADTPTADTTDTTDTTDTETGTTVPATGLFDGSVVGPQGPIQKAQLRFCRGTLCRNGTTDAGGAFLFPNVPEAWHSFEVLPLDGSG